MLYNINDLKAFFGIYVTAEFITDRLGIQPDEKQKRSYLYKPETVVRIMSGLVDHFRHLDVDNIEKVEKPGKTAPEEDW